MPRTSRADANYFSISAGTYQWYAGTPKAQPADYAPDPFVLLPESPQSWDAIAKLCDGTSGIHLNGVQIAQGRENALDLNNGAHDIALVGEYGVGGGQGDQVITVKGGCHDIVIHGVIHSAGRTAHVTIGSWSDQCHEQSHHLDFSHLTHSGPGPLTFVLARCHHVKLPEGAKVLRLKSLGLSCYWWLKLAAVKLHIL